MSSSRFSCDAATLRHAGLAAACYATGALKGLALLPVLLPWQVLTVLFVNLACFVQWLDHGFAAIRL